MSSQSAWRTEKFGGVVGWDSVAMFQIQLLEPFERGPVGGLKGEVMDWEPVAFMEKEVDGEHACATTSFEESSAKMQNVRWR